MRIGESSGTTADSRSCGSNRRGPPESGRLLVTAVVPKRSQDAAGAITASLDRLLGLGRDLREFYAVAAHDPRLLDLCARFRGLKPPRFATAFEALVNAMACQQVSLAAGIHLLNRLAERYGRSFGRGASRICVLPHPEQLGRCRDDALRALGFSRHKSQAIIELASALVHHGLDLEALQAVPDAGLVPWLRRLRTLRGVGPWTAEYTLLGGYGRLDSFPVDDVGGRNNLRRWLGITGPFGPTRARRALERWRPYRGLIYFHLLLDALDRAGHLRTPSPADTSPTPEQAASALARSCPCTTRDHF